MFRRRLRNVHESESVGSSSPRSASPVDVSDDAGKLENERLDRRRRRMFRVAFACVGVNVSLLVTFDLPIGITRSSRLRLDFSEARTRH